MSIRGVGDCLVVSNGLTSKRIPLSQISEICSVSRFYWTEPVFLTAMAAPARTGRFASRSLGDEERGWRDSCQR
jgi:hypothetical protein